MALDSRESRAQPRFKSWGGKFRRKPASGADSCLSEGGVKLGQPESGGGGRGGFCEPHPRNICNSCNSKCYIWCMVEREILSKNGINKNWGWEVLTPRPTIGCAIAWYVEPWDSCWSCQNEPMIWTAIVEPCQYYDKPDCLIFSMICQ